MIKINIITVDNNAGLTRDAKILVNILQQAGFNISLFEVGKPTLGHKLHRIQTYVEKFIHDKVLQKPPYDINLFLQDIVPDWFSYARINCLIPNQEWFRESFEPYLSEVDYVLCKTKYAQTLFNNLGCKTEFISFTSLDCWDQNQEKNYDHFFHLAGSDSIQKGTKTIIDVWHRHPEWPCLTLRQKPQSFHISAPNIDYINNFLDDKTLQNYQNKLGVHLCPSEAEGFGHYIVEGMSTKSIVITTDAPPMNELITSDRGFLANYKQTQSQRLGTNYYVDPVSLEEKIDKVIRMDKNEKIQLGENARNWYLENDIFFRQRFVEFLENIG